MEVGQGRRDMSDVLEDDVLSERRCEGQDQDDKEADHFLGY